MVARSWAFMSSAAPGSERVSPQRQYPARMRLVKTPRRCHRSIDWLMGAVMVTDFN